MICITLFLLTSTARFYNFFLTDFVLLGSSFDCLPGKKGINDAPSEDVFLPPSHSFRDALDQLNNKPFVI
jgi:hypothetical protein